MLKVWNYISGKGNMVVSSRDILAMLASIVGFFHAALLVFFWFFDIYHMVAANVISIIVYWVCYRAAKRGLSLLFVFNTIYIEILLYSIVATLLVGIDSGFMLYLIAIIPLGYYAIYSFRDEDKKINPMIYVISTVLAFWATRIVFRFVEPVYDYGNIIIDRVMYMINYTAIAIAIVVFCSVIVTRVINLEEKQRLQNEALDKLSKLDPLTGLSNRRSIQERCKLAELKNETYAIVLGDIDDFKKVNDTYGHNIGDEVLKAVANVFKNAIRSDDIVCRWGGEEILIFIPEASKEQAELVAERILSKIRTMTVETEDHTQIGVTMTMGVAVSVEAKEFIGVAKVADDRLYVGKRSGKNRIISNGGQV